MHRHRLLRSFSFSQEPVLRNTHNLNDAEVMCILSHRINGESQSVWLGGSVVGRSTAECQTRQLRRQLLNAWAESAGKMAMNQQEVGLFIDQVMT